LPRFAPGLDANGTPQRIHAMQETFESFNI
jgi:hypothetical protein